MAMIAMHAKRNGRKVKYCQMVMAMGKEMVMVMGKEMVMVTVMGKEMVVMMGKEMVAVMGMALMLSKDFTINILSY